MPPIKLPNYAYLPGQNERHPENAFESITRTAILGQDASTLAQSDAFRAGLQFLHAGFYWEAHEVLEPVWMALPEDSAERQLVQALIQLANGHLKLRMRRHNAARRLVGLARALVPGNCGNADAALTTIMTLNVAEVHRWIDMLEDQINLTI